MSLPSVDVSGSAADGEGRPRESVAELTLRAALDVSPDGFAVHRVRRGLDGRAVGFTLEAINTAGAAPHAAGPSDLLGRDLVELLPDPEATGIPAAFRRAADTGVVQTLRTEFDSEDWSGVMDLLVTRIDADRIVATWRDVTEQVRSERVVVEAYTRAQAAWDCLYGVLDAVEDAILLLRVTYDDIETTGGAPEPAAAIHAVQASPAVPTQMTHPQQARRRPGLVVEYLNAAASGARDRSRLAGRALAEVRPDLDLDAVVDLVTAAAADRPGCLRRLVLNRDDGVELASFTASPAPAAVAAGARQDAAAPDAVSTRNVVLVVRHRPEHD